MSAPGKRFDTDKKVTDLLIELAIAAIHNEDSRRKTIQVLDRYKEIAQGLGLDILFVSVIEEDLRSRINEDQRILEFIYRQY